MNTIIRNKLIKRLALQAKVSYTETLTYKDCEKIATALDCDTNTVARLAGVQGYKPTQCLKPELEQKIAAFLGFKTYSDLETDLMVSFVADVIKEFLQREK